MAVLGKPKPSGTSGDTSNSATHPTSSRSPGKACMTSAGCVTCVNPSALDHRQTQPCKDGFRRRMQHEVALVASKAQDVRFTAYGDKLEMVEAFKYLGRFIRFDDKDAQALRGNLGKVRKVWGRLQRVLWAENASSRVYGMFYKATVMSVLLFGSKSWNLPPLAIKCLEGFNLRAARRMTGMRPRKEPDGSWTYPSTEEVLKVAGLHTIAHYIEVRQNTILKFIIDQPIHTLCEDAVRERGTGNRQYWWDQTMDLKAANTTLEVSDSESGF